MPGSGWGARSWERVPPSTPEGLRTQPGRTRCYGRTVRMPSSLRLVWSNPRLGPRPVFVRGGPAPATSGLRRIDLALAIERHLRGADGLSEEDFLTLFSGRAARGR